MQGIYSIEQNWYQQTVSGTGINKCRESERRVGDEGGGKGNTERVQIGKSGCVELENLRKGSGRVNTVLMLCRGLGTAQSFSNLKILWLLYPWPGQLRLWLSRQMMRTSDSP